jgi:hypothetical protein
MFVEVESLLAPVRAIRSSRSAQPYLQRAGRAGV